MSVVVDVDVDLFYCLRVEYLFDFISIDLCADGFLYLIDELCVVVVLEYGDASYLFEVVCDAYVLRHEHWCVGKE